MKPDTKLRGGGDSQLTAFKKLWLYSFDSATRDFWRGLFWSDSTQAQLRQLIAEKHSIKLGADKQMTTFRQWVAEQDDRDAEAQTSEQDKQELESLGLTGDALRAVLLDRMKNRALTTGDFKLGLSAIDRDLKAQQVGLDREKLELLKRKAEAYDRAQAALTAAKDSKGGITRETLTKIEQELKLL